MSGRYERDARGKPLRFTGEQQDAQGAVTWARWRLAAVVALTVLAAACGSLAFYSTEVAFTFDNRTDEVLCYFPSPQDAAAAGCVQELEPRDETKWLPGCGKGFKDQKDQILSNPISVIITVRQGGHQIYNRTATCGEWKDTDRTFIIEQEGEEFMVTDSLPGSTGP